jgi:hypothetical protein
MTVSNSNLPRYAFILTIPLKVAEPTASCVWTHYLDDRFLTAYIAILPFAESHFILTSCPSGLSPLHLHTLEMTSVILSILYVKYIGTPWLSYFHIEGQVGLSIHLWAPHSS